MALEKHVPCNQTAKVKPLSFLHKALQRASISDPEMNADMEADVDVDLREVYFLIMHFLSAGPCQRTCGQFWNELLEHDLLPRRYHSWYSRSGVPSGDENDDGWSFPLSYNKVAERYAHIEKDHLVKLLKQLLLSRAHQVNGMISRNVPNAADVSTLLGAGSFSLLGYDVSEVNNKAETPPIYMRWPHMRADQVRGLRLREIGGGFSRHHRGPSIRAACYTIAKPSTLVQKMQNIKRLRGHRDAVYCAVSDRSGRFVITGSDDRLVKIWSLETAYCLASCRGHEGDITDLAVSYNNALVASGSNDCMIRTWRLPDGQPISVLRGHTGAVNAILFSPRPSAVYQLLSAGDDGTCRLWDARYSQFKPRIYVPKPPDPTAGKSTVASSSTDQQYCRLFCCAFNASGTAFVTGSADNLARVWNAYACKSGVDDSEQPIHEMDVLSGHENDVNYVQFSGCAGTSRFSAADTTKEENYPKFRNSWFAHDNIVTCSRDGSAIIWIPRSRKSHGRAGRWTRAYHLKVPPPPMLPQPPRGGPRQRVQLTPRGVNMIVWSLDNRFVLAAIMDNRICVWNAVDGSLVHSLTGHTNSSFVLDVHPLNPRMAMSAGYDGKTIIWDIWEGKPIRTYDIGHFKLIDGKFSPDGTSIILSDEVGQLYILSTGQGESQKDAKYDQFFLGDYRPLIRDTHANVVDQESQLPPYRRNMQDLLCDSSMIPYPEPYQSIYQQRRLGTLGIEWRPSSVSFAVGPDFSPGQDPILPLPDLDVLIDPLPEIVDAMDWEPEAEIISDETDSEFNVTESLGGDEGNIGSTSSGDSHFSDDDSDAECNHRDGLRRSRRRREKRDKEITTSSGRRVKRRNLDKVDNSSQKVKHNLKSKNRRKRSRKKSSEGSRPRRAAARNALSLFSKIKGKSSDHDEYGSDDVSSGSESLHDDSYFESEESDEVAPDERLKILKGKEVALDDSEDLLAFEDLFEPQGSALKRNRLVLKLRVCDSKRDQFSGHSTANSEDLTDFVGSSSTSGFASKINGRDSTSDDFNGVEGTTAGHDTMRWPGKYSNGRIKWGGVKARTPNPKRIKLSNASPPIAPGFNTPNDRHNKVENIVGVYSDPVTGLGLESGNDNAMLKDATQVSDQLVGFDNSERLAGMSNGGLDKSDRSLKSNGVQAPVLAEAVNGGPSSVNSDPDNCSYEQPKSNVSTRLRFVSRKTISDSDSLEGKTVLDAEHEKNVDRSASAGSMPHSRAISGSEEPEVKNSQVEAHVDSAESNGAPKSDGVVADANSMFQNSQSSLSQRNDRMFSAVYRRSRSFKMSRTCSDGDSQHATESTSNADYQNLNGNANMNGTVADGSQQVHPSGSSHAAEEHFDSNRSMRRSKRVDSSVNRRDKLINEEWGSGITAGVRSTRNRRINFIRDASPVDRRKSGQAQRKLSWLMLPEPDCFRYIPQMGDEVAYLRQGHEEYISHSGFSVRGPWELLKGEIRAVEFCKVVELEYSTVPGSGDSCCKMKLEFIDPSSSMFGKTFKLSLPELSGFPDFLVERTRYEAAVQRNWTTRDKCQVWWKNENDEDGSWWEARIHAVKAKSPDFPDSPWERYHIKYRSDPTEMHSHSPWELYDTDDTSWEQPHLDDHTKKRLLSSFSKLLQSGNRAQDIYGVQKLRLVSEKTNFLNRFPVPLSLDLIQSRLENNYYRSFEALHHDVQVMLSNSESFFAKNAELTKKIAKLSDWFRKTLSTL